MGKKRKNKNNNKNNKNSNVTAPYRFVLPHTEIVLAENEVSKPDINTPLKQGYCATIRVKWCAETPLLIGGVKKKDDKTVNPVELGNTYVLPGSSLKGMLRSAMEITTCARTTIYGSRVNKEDIKKLKKNDKRLPSEKEWLQRIKDKVALDDSPSNDKPLKLDMIQTLFGYVEEEENGKTFYEMALKGRISFGFAFLDKETPVAKTEEKITTALSKPTGTNAAIYLRGPEKRWKNEKSRLAGPKRYFPQYGNKNSLSKAHKEIEKRLSAFAVGKKEAAISNLVFLKPVEDGENFCFTGDIKLHNVTAAELGAVLWTLTHGGDPKKPFRFMLGHAKNVGAGQMRVDRLDLKVTPNNEASKNIMIEPEDWEKEGWISKGNENTSMSPFLQAYEQHMQDQNKYPTWPNILSLREFLGSCCPVEGERIVKNNKHEYMKDRSLDKLENTAYELKDVPANHRYLSAPAIDISKCKFPYQKQGNS